jgi:hypothetical protein
MDETTRELLSRHLDEDLDAEEEHAIEARLEDDPGLRNELMHLATARDAVRATAASERAPDALDRVLDPVRRGAPGAARPVTWRWMAAAAAAVLVASVGLEMARRRPRPAEVSTTVERRVAAAPTARGYYQLQPLPRFVDGTGEERLGAADRLVATPPTSPDLPQPEPLEVMGPLAAAPPGEKPDGEVELEVRVGPDVVKATCRGRLDVAAGWVEVVVRQARVTEVHLASRDGAVTAGDLQEVRSALVGCRLEGVRDGRYRARLGPLRPVAGVGAHGATDSHD